jgi:hypothetical protein
MNKTLPNQAIREALFTLLDGIEVDGEVIPCYDTRVSGVDDPDYYILMSSQTNTVDKSVKCGYRWESEIVIDINTRYGGYGNPGDRTLANAILDEVRDLTQDITVDGFDVVTVTQTFPNDLFLETESYNIFRSFMRLSLLLD